MIHALTSHLQWHLVVSKSNTLNDNIITFVCLFNLKLKSLSNLNLTSHQRQCTKVSQSLLKINNYEVSAPTSRFECPFILNLLSRRIFSLTSKLRHYTRTYVYVSQSNTFRNQQLWSGNFRISACWSLYLKLVEPE